MPNNEKEINNVLFDQLSIVERLDKATEKGEYKQESDIIKKEIKRKLYQKPPIVDDEEWFVISSESCVFLRTVVRDAPKELNGGFADGE